MPHRRNVNYWLSIVAGSLASVYITRNWGWTLETLAICCALGVTLGIYWGMQPEGDEDE